MVWSEGGSPGALPVPGRVNASGIMTRVTKETSTSESYHP